MNKCTQIILMLVLFAVQQSMAQAPAIQWQKCLGGTNLDRGHRIKPTSDGGYIIGGQTYSNDGDVLDNQVGNGYWVIKINNIGTIEWQKVLGGSGDDVAADFQITADGGYIFVGRTNSSDSNITGHHGDYDYWVVKLDSVGNIEWDRALGGTSYDFGYSIVQATDGGYVIAGVINSSNGDITHYYGQADAWVVKLDSTGVLQWQKTYGSPDGDFVYNIQRTNDGGYIIVGATYSNNFYFSNHHGQSDYWVIKIDSVGNNEWQKCYGGSNTDGAHFVQQTNDGGYIVVGVTESINGDVSGHHGNSGYDCWVVKLNNIGTIQWQKCLGGTGSELGNSVQLTADGGYIIAGSTSSINNGDVYGNNGGSDAWIVKLDSTGIIEWQKCLGGTNNDYAIDAQPTNDGGYIIVGYAISNDGDVFGNHGNGDCWVVKLAAVTVPLNILSFSATQQNNNTLLQWQTANEINTSHFNIQRSKNGTEFTTVGKTNAAGSGDNKYSYTDNNIAELNAKTVYYRLQNIDKDGSYTYSKIVQIIYNIQHLTFNIYPNPAKDRVYINGNNINEIRVTDNSGKMVLYKTFNGANNVQLNIATLAKGLYIVQVKDSKGNVGVEKLVVE